MSNSIQLQLNRKEISAHSIKKEQRKELALDMLSKKINITTTAAKLKVSRKFMHAQKNKALAAIDDAFAKEDKDNQILFSLPVTNNWLKQFVLTLTFQCKSSYRDTSQVISDLFDYRLSKSLIANIIDEQSESITKINQKQNLSTIEVGLHDEIYQKSVPVLVGCCAKSLYCYCLSAVTECNANSWGVHLLDLKQRQNLQPNYTITDAAKASKKGQEDAWPGIPIHNDIFHALKIISELSQYIDHKTAKQINNLNVFEKKLNKKLKKKLNEEELQHLEKQWDNVKYKSKNHQELSKDLDIIFGWLKNDIFGLYGPHYNERCDLLNFITFELNERSKKHPELLDRINKAKTYLDNNQKGLLAFSLLLDKKFKKVARKSKSLLSEVYEVCHLKNLGPEHSKYNDWHKKLSKKLQDRLCKIEKGIQGAITSIFRANSLVENINGRLRNYFTLRREVGNKYLSFMQFFFNHKKFIRSQVQDRIGKSPKELLTGQPHDHWLEMLGFERFKQAA